MTGSFDIGDAIEDFQDSIGSARSEVSQAIENSKFALNKISHLSESECVNISKRLDSILIELTELYELVSY